MTLRPAPFKNQFLFVDFLKTVAVQIIILHHLSNYGIIPLKAQELIPTFIDFMGIYGKYAVQIFLVIAGYLTAKSLPQTLHKYGLTKTIINRYLRLMPTYMMAILFTMVCASIARSIMFESYMGDPETFPQLLSHIFFLQNILSYESISVGVWYVAIDWQLYMLTACLLFFLKSYKNVVIVLSFLMLCSLLYFSQHPVFDNYFIYFLGAYGLGILAYIAEDSSQGQTQGIAKVLLILFVILILSITFYDLRIKNLVEMIIALLLFLFGKKPYTPQNIMWSKFFMWFSQRSYCAFLIHFSVLLLCNSAFHLLKFQSPELSILMLVIVWCFSWIFAHILYKLVEFPSRKIQLKS
jgi:peptidoglycan/LPS O-acetylase OafA/YrhL